MKNERITFDIPRMQTYDWYLLLVWYTAFGAIHEATHIVLALATGLADGLFDDGILVLLIRTLFLRQCNLPPVASPSLYVDIVRHGGWVASILLAYFVRNTSKAIRLAAVLSALEALSTDLLYLGPSSPATSVFLCGNFGIIMIHQAWSSNGGSSALDILEKMIQVTMVRGAQSGGVVAFQPHESTMKATRSRVVNKKRTDLSKELRQRIERDISLKHGKVPFISGHTRFATSSKASFEGTHPHRWTPRASRSVYMFDLVNDRVGNSQPVVSPQKVPVENFVTHNGDFDFYNLNGTTYDIDVIQQYLSCVLGPMPSPVDSCAIAGFVDLLRSQGCFGLSARYAICLGLPTSKIRSSMPDFPSYKCFAKIGSVFEAQLNEMLQGTNLEDCSERTMRHALAWRVIHKFEKQFSPEHDLLAPIKQYLTDEEDGGASLRTFCFVTIDAFFDNDLFFTTKTFLKNGIGSFGLCISSSLDAHRQLVIAARGQSMSIAFYPAKGIVCFGSEQAAVKAALTVDFPDNPDSDMIDEAVMRLDLDDLNGEVVVLDWGRRQYQNPPVSKPNEHIQKHELINGLLDVMIHHESIVHSDGEVNDIDHRMTLLSGNKLVKGLPAEKEDAVLHDIHDIPSVCRSIQQEWHSDQAAKSLNRLTAYNLSRCLRKRLESHVNGTVHPRAIDILVTGCEVSLWLGEQFASDLQKAFPNLRVEAVSSNKLLGLYGQDIALPSFGFPFDPRTLPLNDSIIIIVSHSGGTFAPLSCANLLQSVSRNIFVVTSEWDTQIGKQLRAIDVMDDDGEEALLHSRIFTTDVGMRPAEPCSVSVVATHQLLTNLFEYISAFILSDTRFRRCTSATISEQDLQVLERCNLENINALSDIVSASAGTSEPYVSGVSRTTKELRQIGDLWAEHVLENAKAYLMTFLYIFGTILSGFPLAYGVAKAAGFDKSNWLYLIRLLDAAIYFWLPQINILILRIVQGRNLRHRMVCRTVVIADIPWVSQCAEAFLSKIFACSYSIAGLNVLSGNPADHLVHRHTHRVVRGSLLIAGRPDGRLSSLSTAEAAVCLSINQASSIQSWGGTCESVTIGHNPFQLPLTKKAVFLKRRRPLFLCERLLVEADAKEEKDNLSSGLSIGESNKRSFNPIRMIKRRFASIAELDGSSMHSIDSSIRPRHLRGRSAPALIGAYTNFEQKTESSSTHLHVKNEDMAVKEIVQKAIQEKKWSDETRKLFSAMDLDGDGLLTLENFLESSHRLKSTLSEEQLRSVFRMVHMDGSGKVDYNEFMEMLNILDLRNGIKLPPSNRNEKGIIRIEPSNERYFGAILRKYNRGKSNNDIDFTLARSQDFSQELYETRIASLQRFVAQLVLFHQMGSRVERFFRSISFGILGYRMDRTHSIMRIATTASPVSGADVRQRIQHMLLVKKIHHATNVIATAYLSYKRRQQASRQQPEQVN